MAKIAIYAGHGGSDPGAIGVDGLQEKDFNLAVSNAATSILRGLGYTVINNRTTDVDRSITRDANLANEERVDALVEIHMNSNSGTPATGSEAFISLREIGRARALGDAILRRLADLGFVNRGVKTSVNASGQDTFGILRLTNMPAVLLECAFINNPDDMARFDVDNVARAVAEGVREVFPISGGGGGGGGGGLPSYPGSPLRVGVRGESVRQVQVCLNKVINAGLATDGIFGPLTLQAVTNFQRRFGLATDGVIGPITWRRIAEECNVGLPAYPGTPLRVGDRDEYVRAMQTCLNGVMNAGLATDGIFGPLTLQAVTNFQRRFNLTPDGVAGPITWGRLAEECGVNTASVTAENAYQNSNDNMSQMMKLLIFSLAITR